MTFAETTTNRNPINKMNVALWMVQGLLCVLFLFAGVSKLVLPAEVLTQGGLPEWFLRFIGWAETLGAIGLILPCLLRIQPQLTPLAAAGLVIIMIGATALSVPAGVVGMAIPFTAGVLAAFVAYGRVTLAPRQPRGRRVVMAQLDSRAAA